MTHRHDTTTFSQLVYIFQTTDVFNCTKCEQILGTFLVKYANDSAVQPFEKDER